MRNAKLTASYLKDLIDYMGKYHITTATINERFKLYKTERKGIEYLHFVDVNDLENEVFAKTKSKFVEEFKESKFYKINIFE